jgi:hypothetical protein
MPALTLCIDKKRAIYYIRWRLRGLPQQAACCGAFRPYGIVLLASEEKGHVMRKAKCFNGIAAMLVAAVFGSCFLFESDEESPGKSAPAAKTYAINVAETKNGVITAPAKAVSGSIVKLQAASAPVAAVEGQGGSPSGPPPSLHVGRLAVTYGDNSPKEVPWKNNGSNEWLFVMPEGDVTIAADFVEKSSASNLLSSLNVIRPGLTMSFLHPADSYRAEIPHNYNKAPEGAAFVIDARAQDPNADVRITAASGGDDLFGKSIPLVEGETVYTVTVTSTAKEAKDYTLTVSYEPDLMLGAVTLETQDEIGAGWKRPLAAVDLMRGTPVPVLWQTVLINAQPNAKDADLTITKAVNDARTFESSGGSALFDFGKGSAPAAFAIKISKKVGSKTYTKTYPLNIIRDCRADGGDVTIVKQDGVYYEIHTFAAGTSKLAFRAGESALLGRVLVVAGGGGGGGRNSVSEPDEGGGGGGGGVGYSAAFALSGTVDIMVGKAGGSGQAGGDSQFGNIIVKGGGSGGNGYSSVTTGGNGGSGGGGGGGSGSNQGAGGAAIKHEPVYGFVFYGNSGGLSTTGSAGGDGGSAKFSNDISGTNTEYGKGGTKGGKDAAPHLGNGGDGSNGSNYKGGKGGSGVVIVRFPARAPVAQ